MPFSAGGRWVPAPGQSYIPNPRGGDPLPITPSSRPLATVPAWGPTTSEWTESTLTGSRSISVGGRRFSIPRDAQLKSNRRSGTTWVRVDGVTYILSELGMLQQSDAERRATRFDLL